MIIAFVTCAIAVPAIVNWIGCAYMSTQSIATAIHKQGGVIASDAHIIRRSPEGRGGILKNNTLVLINPTVITSIRDATRHSFLILPEQPWVAGAVDLAKITKRELGLAIELDAILPSDVCIFKVDSGGKFIKVESGTINYLQVEESASKPSKATEPGNTRQPPTSYPSANEK